MYNELVRLRDKLATQESGGVPERRRAPVRQRGKRQVWRWVLVAVVILALVFAVKKYRSADEADPRLIKLRASLLKRLEDSKGNSAETPSAPTVATRSTPQLARPKPETPKPRARVVSKKIQLPAKTVPASAAPPKPKPSPPPRPPVRNAVPLTMPYTLPLSDLPPAPTKDAEMSTLLTIKGEWNGGGAEINMFSDRNLILHLSVRPKSKDPLRGTVSVVANTRRGARGWNFEVFGELPGWKRGKVFRLTLAQSAQGFVVASDDTPVLTSAYYRDGKYTVWDATHARRLEITGSIKLNMVQLSPEKGPAPVLSKPSPLPRLGTSDPPLVLIGVLSAPNSKTRRDAQRASWFQHCNNDGDAGGLPVMCRFFVGSQGVDAAALRREAEEFNDMVLLDMRDGYHKLTEKVVLTLKYYTALASRPPIFFKTDEDVYVRVPSLVRELARVAMEEGSRSDLGNYWSGHFAHGGRPIRDTNSKNYLPQSEYSPSKLPLFAYGPAYMLSAALAKRIVDKDNAGSLHKMRLEDASMGLWMQQMREDGVSIRREDFAGHGCSGGVHIHGVIPVQLECVYKNEVRALAEVGVDDARVNVCFGCPGTGGLMGLGGGR